MPIIEAPPSSRQQGEPRLSGRYTGYPDHELHFLLEEVEDERDRSRVREAFWISIILHMLFGVALLISPRLLPRSAVIVTPKTSDHELTYLDLPKDQSKPTPPKKSNFIADKNRIAQTPSPNKRLLDQLRESRRAGEPAPPQQQQAMVQPQAAQPAPQQQAPPQQQQTSPPAAAQPPQQTAKLETPPAPKPVPNFTTGMSAAAAIQQATRAAAQSRSYSGGGDYGPGPAPHEGLQSQLDVLSDTMGVDFDPYLKRVVHDVRMNWLPLIPEEARPPMLMQGKVSIEFAIMKDGSVGGLRIVGPSGDIALDRAASGGISASNPFPPLPSEFGGQYLALRFHFYYCGSGSGYSVCGNGNDLR